MSGEGEGQGNETSEFLESIGSEMGATREEARQAREEARQTREQLGKMREAFNPSQREAPNPLGWYDETLDALFEAEKQGKSMPLTGRLATVLAENQKDTLALRQQIAEQAKVIEQLKNPSSAANQRAFAHIDDSITTTLEGMYGDVPEAFHDAVASEISSILKTLMAEAPEKWEQIRRSDTIQKRLVAHCAQKLVPPAARHHMLEKHESDRPTTMGDFANAARELASLKQAASQGQGPYSAQQLGKMETELRQKAWEFKINGERKYNQPERRSR